MKGICKVVNIMLLLAYIGIAFVLTMSEGHEGEITIYNFIGLGMFAFILLCRHLLKDMKVSKYRE